MQTSGATGAKTFETNRLLNLNCDYNNGGGTDLVLGRLIVKYVRFKTIAKIFAGYIHPS